MMSRPFQEPTGNDAVDFVVLDDQKIQYGIGGTKDGHLGVNRRFRLYERNLEPEITAMIDFALEANFTSQGSHQLATDSQSQTGSTESPGHRTIGLHESAEEVGLAAFRNTNTGVLDR